MTTERTEHPEGPASNRLSTDARKSLGRRVAVAAAVVFIVSSVFPVIAGLSKNTASLSRWWGALDVGVAFVLAVLVIVMVSLFHGKETKQAADATYRAYRGGTHGILAMFVVFFLFGDHIVWINCLPGFAWRAWLLLYSMPAWFTALGTATA